MENLPAPEEPAVLSYLQQRTIVGIAGVALPFVLTLGLLFQRQPWLRPSLSSFYYTGMRNQFVGILCILAVFLLSCKGYDRRDEIAGWLAGIFAAGVAFFPTSPAAGATSFQTTVGYVHYGFAALLFLTLAYFCLVLFTESDSPGGPTPKKLQRNVVYVVCGWIMLGCIAVMATFFDKTVYNFADQFDLTFWLETLAIEAFGVAWLVKGEAILKDDEAEADS